MLAGPTECTQLALMEQMLQQQQQAGRGAADLDAQLGLTVRRQASTAPRSAAADTGERVPAPIQCHSCTHSHGGRGVILACRRQARTYAARCRCMLRHQQVTSPPAMPAPRHATPRHASMCSPNPSSTSFTPNSPQQASAPSSWRPCAPQAWRASCTNTCTRR